MASDIDYDLFDYHSSQDYSQIEDQIDLFELRQSLKYQKQSKRKMKKSSCPISVKNLKSQAIRVKMFCLHDNKTPKAEQKPFRYPRYPREPKFFQCDEEFQPDTKVNASSTLSKKPTEEHLQDFSNFRRHFYQIHHQSIKSALKDYPNIKIVDIRLASVNESVQQEFMKTLNDNPSYALQLVYHGTKLKHIESILRYGFLIPNQAHPTNSEAPIITSENGQSLGKGIYCSQTADYSLSYMNTTNTLLVCAALPQLNEIGKIQFAYGNILVLFNIGRIIPLFFMDFQYLNQSRINQPLYIEEIKPNMTENEVAKISRVISRKYLRKILASMHDYERKRNLYQVRILEPFSL